MKAERSVDIRARVRRDRDERIRHAEDLAGRADARALTGTRIQEGATGAK